MKKAFDQNVSRAKPRVRLATMFQDMAPATEEQTTNNINESTHASVVAEEVEAPHESSAAAQLAAEVKARADRHRQVKTSAADMVTQALEAVVRERTQTQELEVLVSAPVAAPVSAPIATHALASTPSPAVSAPVVESRIEAPPEWVEVQTPAPPTPVMDVSERRERLKERLKAVRENPRPQPLPATVVETGLLAVERIAELQTELTRMKAVNMSLTQELDSARRVAERATEEARARMEEARRLSEEMAGRVKLLNDLETELAALEGERDEVLLALQEVRRNSEAGRGEIQNLMKQLQEKEVALVESLSEEERIASELETAKDESSQLRRALDAVSSERHVLAQQVADLTRERAELLDARKALEAVHRALSHAAAR